MKRATAILALCVSAAWSSTALATSITRSSSFAYDAASGLITQEVVEPGTPALRLETDTTYDVFGNKTSVVTSGIDIATRGNSTVYDARGQFVTTNTNALGQSETLVFDARFGKAPDESLAEGALLAIAVLRNLAILRRVDDEHAAIRPDAGKAATHRSHRNRTLHCAGKRIVTTSV